MGYRNNYVILSLLLSLSALKITNADDIDSGIRKGAMLKFLRQMVNQTKADTLNLPANATSIRENIIDTFSCENRTYGYYADVDNDCQLFHVCLPSQKPSGRNITYRWSFICPNETMFNQEVLTCARPRESINCEDSPMYFDLNMEIGKVDETQENEQQFQHEQQIQNEQPSQNYNQQKLPKIVGVISEKRKPNRKSNKAVVENIRDIVNREIIKREIINRDNKEIVNSEKKQNLQELLKEEDEFAPMIEEIVATDYNNGNNYKIDIETYTPMNKVSKVKEKTNKIKVNNSFKDKIEEDNSFKRKARKIGRGSSRFKADM